MRRNDSAYPTAAITMRHGYETQEATPVVDGATDQELLQALDTRVQPQYSSGVPVITCLFGAALPEAALCVVHIRIAQHSWGQIFKIFYDYLTMIIL